MDRQKLVARGLAWNLAAQLVEAGLVFGGMLVLVRVLAPADYGEFGVVVAIVGLLNAFGAAVIAPYALQLAEGVEPDWSAIFATTALTQLGLSVVCNLIAFTFAMYQGTRSLAPLLRLASLGILLECPIQTRGAMLRRRLDFRRMRILSMTGAALNVGVTIALGVAGWGATAIVIGNYLAMPLPLAVDMVISGWRPRAGWLRGPWLFSDGKALAFAMRGAGSSLLAQGRDALPSAVLAAAFGYGALGFFARAYGLYATTVGRLLNVLVETGYPLLPLAATDRARFASQATLFSRAVVLGTLPAALFVAVAGAPLVAMLYGRAWLDCVPFVAAAGLAFAGRVLSTDASLVLMARGRMRGSFAVDAIAALAVAPCLVLPLVGWPLVDYAWVSGAAALVAGIGGLGLALGELDGAAWLWPVAAAAPAAVAAWFAARAVDNRFAALAAAVAAFGAVFFALLRVAWPRATADLVRRLPLGRHLARLFGA